MKRIPRNAEIHDIKGSTSGITLVIKRVGKSKTTEKAKPKRRAGPRWKGVKGIMTHF